MTTLELEKSATFKNILVATDFSPASKHAVEYAAAITDLNQGQLFVLHALPPEARLAVPLDPMPARTDRDLAEARLSLQKLGAEEPVRHVHHEELLERGPVWEAVLETIERKKIDLLVLGTHGRTGLKKIVLGSTAEELFRRAPCPVLTVGPSAMPRRIRKVLFATDFGPASAHALPFAIDFANKSEGELILLHLVSPMPIEYVGPTWYPGTDLSEREKVTKERVLQQLRNLIPAGSSLKCKVEHLVAFHFAPEGIIDTAMNRDVDLIVMGIKQSGTRAPRLAAHMPWAIAYEVVCHSGRAVLTVRV